MLLACLEVVDELRGVEQLEVDREDGDGGAGGVSYGEGAGVG